MTNGRATKRPRDDEEDSEMVESGSDSDAIPTFLDDDDGTKAQTRKKIKVEASNKDVVRYTAMSKLKSAPKGSIGIPAVRALLAKSSSSSTKHTAAAKETNSGLRRTGRFATKDTSRSGSCKISKGKGKESSTTRGASPPAKSTKLKVAVIIVLHKGVLSLDDLDALEEDHGIDIDDEDTLRPEYVLIKPPAQLSPDVIQRHKHYGLAVVNGTSGMDIDREANFWDIEEMLCSFFPDLFEWFDGLPTVDANLDKGVGTQEHLPQWLLCTKLPGRSSGVSVAAGVAFPTGSDIDFNVQTKRSGFRENILILTTRTPVPTELLYTWQKRVGKKPVKSIPARLPSPTGDSDTDWHPPAHVLPLVESTYLPSKALVATSAGADAIAGPSYLLGNKTEKEIIEIEDSPVPSPKYRRTASPTYGMVENLNTAFSGSFYVDESLKDLNPWEANPTNESWEF